MIWFVKDAEYSFQPAGLFVEVDLSPTHSVDKSYIHKCVCTQYSDECPLLLALGNTVEIQFGLIYLRDVICAICVSHYFCRISSVSYLFNVNPFSFIRSDNTRSTHSWQSIYIYGANVSPLTMSKKRCLFKVSQQLLSYFCKALLQQ